jgi:hypothetical protein
VESLVSLSGMRNGFNFSQHDYNEMLLILDDKVSKLTIGINPMILNRPENNTEIPGPLEKTL